MPLVTPNLDDRTYAQLLDAALTRLRAHDSAWDDLSPGDPGIVVLELFAFLTETLLYRVNRIPDKAYIEFLRLLGVTLRPPAAASALLRFSTKRPAATVVTIPPGTRVTTDRGSGGGEGPVFVTHDPAVIPAGGVSVDVLAHHCEVVEGELLGTGSGLPGLSLSVARAPVVAPTPGGDEFMLGVEATEGELQDRVPARQWGAKAFRLWRAVPNFTDVGDDGAVFMLDRLTGQVVFAPAIRRPTDATPDSPLSDEAKALAEVPAPGREIRAWYWRGGGASGNVGAGRLTVRRDQIPGVDEVTNPEAATGGREAESLENALVRGPHEMFALERAVTARDYEYLAARHPAVDRARAVTRAELWTFAEPGAVEVTLVPHLGTRDDPSQTVTAERLHALETSEALAAVDRELSSRRPLGTQCIVRWANYKTIRVSVRIVVYRGEDQDAVADRVRRRLYQTISPLRSQTSPEGWRFGQAMRVSNVYDIVLSGERGVRYVEPPVLRVDNVPNSKVLAVAADPSQPHTWYVGSADRLFRSSNDGDGWELAASFAGEQVEAIRPNRFRPGVVAVVASKPDGSSVLHLSTDCGESWTSVTPLAETVHDVAWAVRDGQPLLFIAADRALYSYSALTRESPPVQVLVDPADPNRGFYAVACAMDDRGRVSIAAAAQESGGIWLSRDSGRDRTFRNVGLTGDDIRVLIVSGEPATPRLWAGVTVPGRDPGKGTYRWTLGPDDPPEGWVLFSTGWNGASCHSLAFRGPVVLAATTFRGVLRLDTSKREPQWQSCDVRCGLPTRDPGPFNRLEAVASGPDEQFVLVGGEEGVYRSTDGGDSYVSVSASDFVDIVTVPATWLFCSGHHEVTVVSEDAPRPD